MNFKAVERKPKHRKKCQKCWEKPKCDDLFFSVGGDDEAEEVDDREEDEDVVLGIE